MPSFYKKGRHFLSMHRKWFLPLAVFLTFSLFVYFSAQHYLLWASDPITRTLLKDNTLREAGDIQSIELLSSFFLPTFSFINRIIGFLIPSYDGGVYFLYFLLTRLWGEYFISLIFALIFLWAMLTLNKKYESRFFYDEEPYFGAVAIFITGWPGWLYYLIVLLATFLVFNAMGTVMARRGSNFASSDNREQQTSIFSSEGGSASGGGLSDDDRHPMTGESRFSLYYFWLPVAIAIILLMYAFGQELPYYFLLKI